MPYFLLTFLVLIIDQLVKIVIVMKLLPFQNVWIISNVFAISYVRNYGAAFGIMQSQKLLLIILSLLVILLVWFNRHKLTQYPKILQMGLAIALGGALGNLVDRIRLGYVVDFLDFQVWPVFNIADIGIVCGVGLIILGLFFEQSQIWKKISRGPQEVSRGSVSEEDIK